MACNIIFQGSCISAAQWVAQRSGARLDVAIAKSRPSEQRAPEHSDPDPHPQHFEDGEEGDAQSDKKKYPHSIIQLLA